jgi:outer membrane lipoprotein-sorting protein
MLQGWTALDAQNNRTSIRLSNQRFNVAVADSAFRYTDPRRRRGPRG